MTYRLIDSQAQWAGMAKVALQEFPIVMNTIRRLDRILGSLKPEPDFKITELLLDNGKNAANLINEAEIAQPLCTAIQIALVDLFYSWNILPSASVGHSSGEIGAAYAAGRISAPEAIIIAYCRGRAVAQVSTPGSMLAVGLGVNDIQEHLASGEADVCIACENSPNSVTLSGSIEAISKLRDELDSKGIFVRELRTGKAYHSAHMLPVSAVYDVMLSEALTSLSNDDILWRLPKSQMISTVTGTPVQECCMDLDYWSANLRQRVLFDSAIQYLGTNNHLEQVNLIIEIGPHSALAGPFKQICTARGFERLTYIPSLVRKKNDAVQLLSVAGSLFLAGYRVDLEKVTLADPSQVGIHKRTARNLIVDLPPYQWNYEKQYWTEPRGSAEQRARHFARHDLLGSQVSGLTSNTRVWRNVLRHRDVPWLKDHNVSTLTFLSLPIYQF